MAKIPEAEARLFRNIFVCRKCKTKIRASSMKVTQGKIRCRKCGSRALRPVRKK
ncbi:50S ribosomal protein L40e [Candidatus Woesearchaeota archaeon]|nr:50S ribosomal protein L40e [Candidatus Woesearchaeota archaeon]